MFLPSCVLTLLWIFASTVRWHVAGLGSLIIGQSLLWPWHRPIRVVELFVVVVIMEMVRLVGSDALGMAESALFDDAGRDIIMFGILLHGIILGNTIACR